MSDFKGYYILGGNYVSPDDLIKSFKKLGFTAYFMDDHNSTEKKHRKNKHHLLFYEYLYLAYTYKRLSNKLKKTIIHLEFLSPPRKLPKESILLYKERLERLKKISISVPEIMIQMRRKQIAWIAGGKKAVIEELNKITNEIKNEVIDNKQLADDLIFEIKQEKKEWQTNKRKYQQLIYINDDNWSKPDYLINTAFALVYAANAKAKLFYTYTTLEGRKEIFVGKGLDLLRFKTFDEIISKKYNKLT